MKQYIAKIELLETHDNTIRVRVSTRSRHLRISHRESLFPRHSTLSELLAAKKKMYVLLRASRQRQVHFVCEVEAQSW